MWVNAFLKFLVFYYSGFCKQKTKNFKKVFTLNLQKKIYSTHAPRQNKYATSLSSVTLS
ncbi:hypothetical protein [uncultured Gammaproteobacteria bacterium]|uniref:Uncharacterized protein n=2 Tax=sulfur-oxidizing symbionts TaxID=32036 RepID=A0ACA8ZPQ1_9GAMM|nr:hypothetical protein AZO1586R_1010 [Bathymodiolus azoricus thioautotrophic gill symbiont]CAB5503649.1 hypothetical protein AZO1586I_1163 [Bathymodiolus thermophilus thioautotrophic gill symbiont]CAC9496058.1 hypothetical protein [uncultured Gammaproteobacteria bacterium]CAC9504856.1 hypothetical protein [uncultured Gammaproteobacteria bacterium]CAC9989608.1 hypothetical protein [uncultured Gammaproteobacteria bacterium]